MPHKAMCQSTQKENVSTDPRALSDESLAHLAAGGDREAAAEFMRRHEGLLRARYRWKLKQQPERLADTEDLISTVTRRLDSFVSSGRLLASGPGRLFEFVNRVADRASAEIVRRSTRSYRKHRVYEPRELPGDPVDRPASVAETIGDSELNERDRVIVRLRIAGVAYKQIAESLGISAGLARERYRLAIRKLAKSATSDTKGRP